MIKLDPRTKVYLLVVTNIITFSYRGSAGDMYLKWIMTAVSVVLLLASGKIKAAAFFTVAYVAVQNMKLIYSVIPIGSIVGILIGAAAGLVSGMGPAMIMAYYLIATTSVSEAIAAMERVRLSYSVIIPLTIMFRFFPTIKEEAQSIGDAMRMRGITYRKGPIAMMEYRLVPLVMSVVKIGEDLSAAAVTRGLGGHCKRTNVCTLCFSVWDFLFAGAATALLVIYIVL